jgi:acid phosphatase type 7
MRSFLRRFVVLLPLLALMPGIATASSPTFADGFETGDLGRWATVAGDVTTQQAIVAHGSWAAALSAGGSPAYLRRSLTASVSSLYARSFFAVEAHTTEFTLLTFRDGAGVPILRFGLGSAGELFRLAVQGNTVKRSTSHITDSAWHELQVHVTVRRSLSRVDVWLDGAPLSALSGKVRLGRPSIGQIEVGDDSIGHTFDVAVDDVAADVAFIPAPDSSPPTQPTDLIAASATSSRVDLQWSPSRDDTGVDSYTVYRNGSTLGTTSTTSFADSAVVPSKTYTYTVDALDGWGNRSSQSAPITVEVPGEAAGPWVVMAAGDIACDPADPAFNAGTGTSAKCRQRATSDLLAQAAPDAVLALGDNQYECAGTNAFISSYDLAWGRMKSITYPVVGNHEYFTSGGTDCDTTGGARGYFQYFGARAGDPASGYYSFDIGPWHLIALNSECGKIGGCGVGSPQELWLRSDLEAHPTQCTLAFYHRPRFGPTGTADTPALGALWADLEARRVDVVLNGHVHAYDRFKPMSSSGQPDPDGIREFIVGTGGKSLQSLGTPVSTVDAQGTSSFGVLRLSLSVDSYAWSFLPVTKGGFTDSGSSVCV